FQTVRVPGDVVVKQDVTELKVDAFAGCLRGDQNLEVPVLELLFRPKARTSFFPRPGLHTAVNETHLETPIAEAFDQIVQCVLELREDQKALVRPIKEALLPEHGAKLG